jgi:hypothetical protein
MADLPKHDDGSRKGKGNKRLLLGIIYAIFVVASLAAMVAIDSYGEAKMGKQSVRPAGAPDD